MAEKNTYERPRIVYKGSTTDWMVLGLKLCCRCCNIYACMCVKGRFIFKVQQKKVLNLNNFKCYT